MSDESRVGFEQPVPSPGMNARSWKDPTVLRLALLGSAVLLFISLFLPWYSVSVSSGGRTFSAGVDAWDSFGSLQIFLCLFAILLGGVAGWELYTSSSAGARLQRFAILPVLAVLAAGLSALLTFIHLFDIPSTGVAAAFGVSITLSYGIFLALVAALVAAVAAVQLAINARAFEWTAATFRSLGSASADRPSHGGTDSAMASPKRGSQPSYLDELERLDQLHQRGVITDDEFTDAKKRLLGDVGAQRSPS